MRHCAAAAVAAAAATERSRAKLSLCGYVRQAEAGRHTQVPLADLGVTTEYSDDERSASSHAAMQPPAPTALRVPLLPASPCPALPGAC